MKEVLKKVIIQKDREEQREDGEKECMGEEEKVKRCMYVSLCVCVYGERNIRRDTETDTDPTPRLISLQQYDNRLHYNNVPYHCYSFNVRELIPRHTLRSFPN